MAVQPGFFTPPLHPYSHTDHAAEKFYVGLAAAAALAIIGTIGLLGGAPLALTIGGLSAGYAWWKHYGEKKDLYEGELYTSRAPTLRSAKLQKIKGRLESYLHDLGFNKSIRIIDEEKTALTKAEKEEAKYANAASYNFVNDQLEQRTATLEANHALVRILNSPELEGIMQHEVAHQARDNAWFDSVFDHIESFAKVAAVMGACTVSLALIALWPLQKVIHLSFQRQEELRADRGAVFRTRNPEAYAAGLIKIYADAPGNTKPLSPKQTSRQTIAEHTRSGFPTRAMEEVCNFFTGDHPTLERRLQRIDMMEAQLQTTPRHALSAAKRSAKSVYIMGKLLVPQPA